MRVGPALREAGRLGMLIGSVLLLAGGLIVLVSREPLTALSAFLTGPLSRPNRLGNWIEESVTLTLVGLAVALVFQVRLFSLGAEGQLYLGALAAGSVGLFVPLAEPWRLVAALTAALLAAGAWGALPGGLKAYWGANEIVSSLMLNVIAIQGYGYVLASWLRAAGGGRNASAPLPEAARLLPLVPDTRINLSLLLAAAAVVMVWAGLFRTTGGYALRMTGFNDAFAAYGGINVRRVQLWAAAVSGGLAGLAGAALALGIHGRVVTGISVGYGFDGVVVALLARNHPLGVPAAALLYGYLRIGADVMERSSDVSRELVTVLQAGLILLVSAEAFVGWARGRWARGEVTA